MHVTAPRARLLATVAASVGCLAVVPVTVARATGGGAPFPGPVLAAAAPFALPALVLAAVLALLGRSRRLAAVPALLLVPHLVWAAPSWLPDGELRPPLAGAGPVTVLTSNILFGRADAQALVAAVTERRVDVLVVQELTAPAVERLRAAGLERELPHSVLLPDTGAAGSGVWSRWPAQALPPVAGTTFGTPRARLALSGGRGVTVTAAHPFPPLRGATIDDWTEDLALLRAAVETVPGPQVVAGDFNATRDHAPFRRLITGNGSSGGSGVVLRDAADAVGLGAWPGMTWPANRAYPAVMRIDHVLVSPEVAVEGVDVLTIPGTDHRAVLARLRL